MTFFVSGTDTDVGKTIASAILCKILDSAYWKPVQSGTDEASDTQSVLDFLPELKTYKEAYAFKAPLSPHRAAELENKEIDLEQIIVPEHSGNLLIEGAGGLMVPLNHKFLLIDWVARMSWPVILVSKHYLGSINHTLLSVSYLKQYNIPIAGILFNGAENKATEQVVSEFADVPILGRIEEAEVVNQAFVEKEAKRISEAVLNVLSKWREV